MDRQKTYKIKIIKKEAKRTIPITEKNIESAPAAEVLDVLEWEAPEYVYREKSTTWYIGSAVIALLLLLFGALTRNYFFIIMVIIGELLALFWGSEEPPIRNYRIDEKGVTINDLTYPYRRLSWYALDEDGDMKKIVIQTESRIRPRLHLYLDSPEFEESVRSALTDRIQENTGYEEPFFDALAKLVRF